LQPPAELPGLVLVQLERQFRVVGADGAGSEVGQTRQQRDETQRSHGVNSGRRRGEVMEPSRGGAKPGPEPAPRQNGRSVTAAAVGTPRESKLRVSVVNGPRSAVRSYPGGRTSRPPPGMDPSCSGPLLFSPPCSARCSSWRLARARRTTRRRRRSVRSK